MKLLFSKVILKSDTFLLYPVKSGYARTHRFGLTSTPAKLRLSSLGLSSPRQLGCARTQKFGLTSTPKRRLSSLSSPCKFGYTSTHKFGCTSTLAKRRLSSRRTTVPSQFLIAINCFKRTEFPFRTGKIETVPIPLSLFNYLLFYNVFINQFFRIYSGS